MSTAFVTLCDAGYFPRAHQTIKDLRTRGGWLGDIVLIAVDFVPSADFLSSYKVESVSFPRFDISAYVEKLRAKPFSCPTDDGREYKKLTQWEKLHVFDPFFKRWERIVWLDAGLRVLDSVGLSLFGILGSESKAGERHREQITTDIGGFALPAADLCVSRVMHLTLIFASVLLCPPCLMLTYPCHHRISGGTLLIGSQSSR
jgi:hypothetical protein